MREFEITLFLGDKKLFSHTHWTQQFTREAAVQYAVGLCHMKGADRYTIEEI